VYCSKCGSELASTASFCARCGQPVSVLAPSPAALPPVAGASSWPAPVVSTPVLPPSYGGVGYAGFWLRFVAYLIDAVISSLAFAVLLIPFIVLSGLGGAFSKIGSGEGIGDDVAPFLVFGFIFGVIGIILVVSWLYFALSESSSWQATPGKKILNLQVTDTEGQRLSFGRASGRFFAKMITGMIPLAIGYIMAGFTEKKQALHDIIAGCLVIRQE